MLKRLAMVTIACAKTYTFVVSEPTRVCAGQLKPGEYNLKVDGSQVVLRDNAGHQIDVAATVKDGDTKFDRTAVLLSKADGTNRIESVQLGGSKMTVVFQSDQADRVQ